MELVGGFEPPTCSLRVNRSTDWATPAKHWYYNIKILFIKQNRHIDLKFCQKEKPFGRTALFLNAELPVVTFCATCAPGGQTVRIRCLPLRTRGLTLDNGTRNPFKCCGWKIGHISHNSGYLYYIATASVVNSVGKKSTTVKFCQKMSLC